MNYTTKSRLSDSKWLLREIKKLADSADNNVMQDMANLTEVGNSNERDKYEARAETAKYYRDQLRRILTGKTWDEAFTAKVRK